MATDLLYAQTTVLNSQCEYFSIVSENKIKDLPSLGCALTENTEKPKRQNILNSTSRFISIEAELKSPDNFTVGLKHEISIEFSTSDDVGLEHLPLTVAVYGESNETPEIRVQGVIKNRRISFEFIPTHGGAFYVKFRCVKVDPPVVKFVGLKVWISSVVIFVDWNDPLTAFNFAEHWPVGVVCVCEKTHTKQSVAASDDVISTHCSTNGSVDRMLQNHDKLYVQYSNHIVEFNSDGNFERIVFNTNLDEYINDLDVSPSGSVIAISVNGERMIEDTNDSSIIRFLEIRLLIANSGELIHKLGWDPSVLQVPVSKLTFITDHHLAYVNTNTILLLDVREKRNKLKIKHDFVSLPSKMKYKNHKLYIAYSVGASIEILNDEHKLLAGGQIQRDSEHCDVEKLLLDESPIKRALSRECLVKMKFNDNMASITGLDIDNSGLIIVAEAITGLVHVYSAGGHLVRQLRSEWDSLMWPMGLCLSGDQKSLYVADHGNGCVKKYKYS